MHCDDKRTIFALKKILEENFQEQENYLLELENEQDPRKKLELNSKINTIEKSIIEIKHQLGTMK